MPEQPTTGPAAYPEQPAGYPQPDPYAGQAYAQDPYAAQGYPAAGQAYPAPYPYAGQPAANYDPMAKSQLAAGLFGIFLGSLGIHRFYLGYVGIGILQIFVTIITMGLGGIWGFIEGIMILAGAQSFRTDATGRPLKQ